VKKKTSIIPIDDIDEFSDEEINEAIRIGIPERGAFFAMLTRIRMDSVQGATEFDRGVAEGIRLLAAELQDRARAKETKLNVKTSKE
jgi:hypothetical protein